MVDGSSVEGGSDQSHPLGGVGEALRGTVPGLLAISVVIGCGAGLGAVAFRYLIFGFTWIFTGYRQYGLQGRVPSLHVPWLGPWFLIVAPVVGGLLFGPLIYFFAREARGHGVPEVMVAVAENGGRIRPQVSVVKALASALCIASGGSVGREGPIVQIGSALASSLGQLVRMSESRLRILVACGAAGGISATFNAPLTGVFFGLELILGEISMEGFVAVLTASMTADTISQAFFGHQPFFAGLSGVEFPGPADYALCALLGLIAGGVGIGFKWVLYRIEDLCDDIWKPRPEWLRPTVGGIVLGLLLLAIPQMYGVGYPVMLHALAGGYVFWFLLLLVVAKMVATSLSIGVGGSGGVFAPSLFIGACLGTSYGMIMHHLLGSAAGPVAAYGLVAMGAVFAGASRAPLTATASVVEMSGNFGVVLPVMLATAIATAVSARLSHGTIYTTKLLRRGIDISRPRPATLMQVLTVAEAMFRFPALFGEHAATASAGGGPDIEELTMKDSPGNGGPQALFENETLEQALRQLVVYGHRGLPVMAEDGRTVVGWITNQDVMRTFADRLGRSLGEAEQGARAAEFAADTPVNEPYAPLHGYRLETLSVPAPPSGAAIEDLDWARGAIPVSIQRGSRRIRPEPGTPLRPRDVVTVLRPAPKHDKGGRVPTEGAVTGE
jgi:CIC family chloride channel protein